MVANKGLDSLNNSWTNAFTALSDFKEAVTYDGNGNILTYNRNGNKTFAGSPLGMDSLTYHYRPGTNKLSYVTDLVRGANYGNDIDNQSIGNYKYDSIGNMVSDVRAGVDSIKWNVYGKIARIYKHDSTSIVYAYDAAGNRISKSVISKTNDTVQTFYVRDATGNILSTYTYRDTSVNNGQLSQIEANLYSSSRLGMTTLATNVQDATPTPTTSIIGLGYGENITFTRGKKFFELTNHLGNVLATVSDRKIGVSFDSLRISSYTPVINSAQEYYPFGMLMPGRGGHIGTGKNVAGSTVVMNGDTIPATLTVTQRTNNTPGTYMATQTISFEGEFASGTGDEFTTLFVDQSNADPGTESGISYGIAAKGYRYGFNRQERSDDMMGEGNHNTAEFWEYDNRTGRRWNLDPNPQTGISEYSGLNNNPIYYNDVLGNEPDPPFNWSLFWNEGLNRLGTGLITEMMRGAISVNYAITTYRWPTKEEYWSGVKERWSYTAWTLGGAANGLNKVLSFGMYDVQVENFNLNYTQSGYYNTSSTVFSSAPMPIFELPAANSPRLAIASETEVSSLSIKLNIQIHPVYFAKSQKPKSNANNGEPNWSSKSGKTFGHTFIEHGQKKSVESMADRSRSRPDKMPIGRWLNDEKAAAFIKSIFNTLKPGENIVNIPDGLGEVIYQDKTREVVNRAKIILTPNREPFLIRTGYPIK
jgi:hypothetical protein